jgi:transforming growth factor-beta-induced protein
MLQTSFHTLTQPIYTNYITDGMVVKSVGGPDVKISLVGNDIYFNDAKVISPNVITNNGIIHVLDKVMSPNGTAPAASSGTATATTSAQTGSSTVSTKTTSTSTTTSASASSGAGGSVGMMAPAGAIGGLAALAAGVALIL